MPTDEQASSAEFVQFKLCGFLYDKHPILVNTSSRYGVLGFSLHGGLQKPQSLSGGDPALPTQPRRARVLGVRGDGEGRGSGRGRLGGAAGLESRMNFSGVSRLATEMSSSMASQ